MGINRFSQAVNPPSLYKGTSDELDILSHQVPYERASNLVNSVNQAGQNIFGINAPGKDGEILAQKSQEVQAAIKELAKFGLDKPEVRGRINNLISSMSNDPDVLGITQRVGSYQKELENKKAAEAKGEKFTSPLLKQAEDYYNSGVYLKDTRFNRSGWITPNDAKSMKSAKELVEKKKGWRENPDGTREEYEYYDPADLKAALTQVYNSDPNYEKELSYQFEEQTKDINWDDYSKEENATIAQEARNTMMLAESLYNSAKDEATRQKALERYTEASKNYSLYADAYDNPSSAEEIRQNYYNDFKNRRLQMSISAMDAEQRKPIAMNEIKKAQMELSNDIAKDREKQILELEIASGISRNTPNFFSVASSKVQTDKQTNAKLANPNYKITSSDAIIGYTEKQWGENVFVTKNGVTKIPDNPGSKTMIKKLILSDPNKFPEIPQEVIEVLQNDPNADIIDIVDGNIEIDPSYWNPNAPKYKIKAVDALQRKNEIMKPKDDSTQPTSATGSESKLSPINGFEVTQYTVGNDTVTAPIITNLSDTSKIDKGAYFSYNGELYKN